MCTVLLPPGGYPIAVNKYIITSHHSWRYSPGWSLAYSTICLHFSLSCIVSIHCFILNIAPTFQVVIVKSDFQTPFINVYFSSFWCRLLGFKTDYFPVWGCQPHTQPPTWRTRVSLFVWVIALDLSGMGGPTSSIRYRQHSCQVRMTMQPPPLHQSRDTFGGNKYVIFYQKLRHNDPTHLT